jgi:predicted anti-sigma-YlaC factor YlaD
MNCKDFNRLMLPYIDGDIIGKMAEECELHLNDCSTCRDTFVRVQDIYGAIGSEKSQFTPSPFLAERVLALAREKHIRVQQTRSIRYLAVPTLAAASVAMGIVLGSMLSTISAFTVSPDDTDSIELLADEYLPNSGNNPYYYMIDETE